MEGFLTYDQILTSMQEKYEELTGAKSDDASDIGIRLRILAGQISGLYEKLEELRRQVFPQTSTGVYLERHAEFRGLFRKSARYAQGTLRFSRETPSVVDIPIAQGVVCATGPAPQLQYATTESGLLAAGEYFVDIPAKAVDPGRAGNTGAGAVCIMVSTVPGITSVQNTKAFVGGLDEESDDALRERLLEACRSVSNGTNSAFYYGVAMSRDGVTSVNVIPRARGRGTVDVVVCCADSEDPVVVAEELRQEISLRREINVDVEVAAAVVQNIVLEVQIAIGDAYDFTEVEQRCSTALRDHVSALKVGEPLYIAKLYSRLLQIEGVSNLRVDLPAEDMRPTGYQVFRPGTVSVRRMEVT